MLLTRLSSAFGHWCADILEDPFSPSKYLSMSLQESADILATARLLVEAFAPDGGLNVFQNALVYAEHVLGLQDRMHGNILLVCRAMNGDLAGFVEVVCRIEQVPYSWASARISSSCMQVYTPRYLASQSGTGYPERVVKSLKPYVASLAVAKTWRCKGVASSLMRAAEDCARQAGESCLALEVEDTNMAALALYSKLDYSIIRRDEHARKLVGDILFGKSERVTKLWLEKGLVD